MKQIHVFIEDLKKKGYSVKFNASFKGKSGATHRVDVLAENHQGKKHIAMKKNGKVIATEIINTFAVALDAEAEACYIIDKALDTENRKLAKYYKITLLTKDA